MSHGDKVFYGSLAIIVIIFCSVFGLVAYQFTHVWNETGTISWVGSKVYDDPHSRFVEPFAVTVPVHGTFNFTETGFNTICGNASGQTSPMFKGTVVALIKLQCGGYDLVVDP
jgi:hypothetical protein